MSPRTTHHSSYSAARAATARRGFLLAASATAAWLAGCAASKPVVTPVQLELVGGADMNPDARGRASPLTVRVYALKAADAFQSADFFALYDKESATLGADLLRRDEVLLRPGETRTLSLTLPAEVVALGLVADYRDLHRAQWRHLWGVKPGVPVQAVVTLGALQPQLQRR